MTKHLQVLIVDDQQRSRQSLRALLATWPQVAGIREARNGDEAIRLAADQQPDLVLMDIRMPEMGGLQSTRLIKDHWPHVKIVLLSMYSEYERIAQGAGADAFVSKGEPPEKLMAILEAVAQGIEI